jgi:hypothetical protein
VIAARIALAEMLEPRPTEVRVYAPFSRGPAEWVIEDRAGITCRMIDDHRLDDFGMHELSRDDGPLKPNRVAIVDAIFTETGESAPLWSASNHVGRHAPN